MREKGWSASFIHRHCEWLLLLCCSHLHLCVSFLAPFLDSLCVYVCVYMCIQLCGISQQSFIVFCRVLCSLETQASKNNILFQIFQGSSSSPQAKSLGVKVIEFVYAHCQQVNSSPPPTPPLDLQQATIKIGNCF